MNITQSQKNDPQIINFENKEWKFADIEHYGKNHKYFRKTYKFVAKDHNEKIIGFIELLIEPNIAFIEGLLVDHEPNYKVPTIEKGKNIFIPGPYAYFTYEAEKRSLQKWVEAISGIISGKNIYKVE